MWHVLLLWFFCAGTLYATQSYASPQGGRMRTGLKSHGDNSQDAISDRGTRAQSLWSTDRHESSEPGQGKGKTESFVAEHKELKEQLLRDWDLQVKYMESEDWKRENETRAEGKHRLTRGIVIPSGGEQLLNMTWAAVKVLRETLKSNLPVEIIYKGPEEMDPHIRRHFEGSFKDVRCIDSSLVAGPTHPGRPGYVGKGQEPYEAAGYVHKLFALCHATSFDEVLMIDGDNTPLLNPEELFQSARYQVNGNLFWPDFWSGSVGNMEDWLREEAYTLFGLSPPWKDDPDAFATTESGQILINRVMHADVLHWAWFLNSHHEIMYRLFWGDKDTFRLAFHLAKKEQSFEQVLLRPGVALDINVGVDSEGEEKALRPGRRASRRKRIESFQFAGTVQYSSEGQLAFYHRIAGSKFVQTGSGFSQMRIFTMPLSPQRALPILHHGGLYARDMIDLEALRHCPSSSERILEDLCRVDAEDGDFPIPAIPLSAFPRTAKIVKTLEERYKRIQSFNRIPLAWWEFAVGMD